jgi:hypothetical protein
MRATTALVLTFASTLAASMVGAQIAPPPRAGHVMTSAGPGGGVLLLAGQIDTVPHLLDSLWQWDGSAWRFLSAEGPHERTLPAAAFDTRRNLLVLYGGYGLSSQTMYGDLWEWDGRSWTERTVLTPGPRDHHAMAFDAARGVTVMYGGQGSDRSLARDTWAWNGEAWNRVDSLSGPGGLAHHAMAYDSRRQRVVMFGGIGPSRRGTTDTWEWDGAKWTRVATEGPPPISAGRMAFDAARGVTVLFGGDRSRNETWTWDGTAWKRFDVPGPSPRNVHAMAYDIKRQRVVLFGGAGPGGPGPYRSFSDVWEWDGVRWTRVRQ